MTDKQLIITLAGSEDYINSGIDGMAYNNGYPDTIKDENGDDIPNPQTKLEFCTRILSNFLRANVIAWNTKQAQAAAALAAKQGATSALDAITISSELKDAE